MPAAFPSRTFRAFGIASARFFPRVLSDEYLSDPVHRTTQHQWSWQAVRYRYRTCSETADEFQVLVASGDEGWRVGMAQNEELTYKLERCIYIFFLNALSIFESFAFCLYFVGSGVRPSAFPLVRNPRRITIKLTAEVYEKEFPKAAISDELKQFLSSAEFRRIDVIRNLLAHRVSGRKSVQGWSTVSGQTILEHRREESWHIPGCPEKLQFSGDMLHAELRQLTVKLRSLVTAANQFARRP